MCASFNNNHKVSPFSTKRTMAMSIPLLVSTPCRLSAQAQSSSRSPSSTSVLPPLYAEQAAYATLVSQTPSSPSTHTRAWIWVSPLLNPPGDAAARAVVYNAVLEEV